MDVSVILVNYNTKDLTFNCIQSIKEQTREITYEIILIDNASNDGSVKLFEDNFSNIKIIKNAINIGFGKACNQGLEVSQGKYSFFLNTDTILLNNAIKLLFDFYEVNNKILYLGVIGCLLIDTKGNNNQSFDYFPTPKKIIKKLVFTYLSKIGIQKNKQIEIFDTYYFVDYIIGADIFINSNLVKKYKGFSPDYFMYYEETDLQFRLKQDGFKSCLIKGPKIVHFEGQSSKKTSIEKLILLDKSLFIYFKKYEKAYMIAIFKFLYFIFRLFFLFNFSRPIKDKLKYLNNILKC